MARTLPLKVGDVVTVARPVLNNGAGALATVVDIYDVGNGPSPVLLFRNGSFGGFPPADLVSHGVKVIRHEGSIATYQFTTADQVRQDYACGVFAAALREPVAAGGAR